MDATNVLVYVSEDHSVYWQPPYGNTCKYTTGGVIQSSPTLFNGLVHIGSNDGTLSCLSCNSNGFVTVLWKYTAPAAVQSSPAVTAGAVVAASVDGTVFALNAFDGALLWTSLLPGHVTSSPTLDGYGGVYIGCSDHNLYALSVSSGAVLWKFETGGVIQQSTPALSGGGVLVFGSSDSNVYAVNSQTGVRSAGGAVSC